MNEACDRCGPAVRAAYRVERRRELYLCRHCASQRWAALCAQGWTIWPAGVLAVAPQANEFSGASCPGLACPSGWAGHQHEPPEQHADTTDEHAGH